MSWLVGAAASCVLLFAACSNAPPKPPVVETESPAPAPEVPSLGLVRGLGDETDAWLAKGERYFAAGELSRARDAFARAAQLSPEDPSPLVGLTLVRIESEGYSLEFAAHRGDPEVQRLLEELERTPNDRDIVLSWRLRGQLALLLGEGERARPPLERAALLAPDDALIQGALAIACLAVGDATTAIASLERATELAPENGELWTNLGAAWMMGGQVENARTAYQRAVALSPSSARAHSDLGTTLLALGQPRAALTELEAAHRLAPDRATVMSNLGYAMQTLGNAELAETWYQRALEKDPSLGSAWVNLAVLRAQQGRFDDAEAALRRALELDPEDPRALQNLDDLAAARRAAAGTP